MSKLVTVRKFGSDSETEQVDLADFSTNDIVELGPKSNRMFYWKKDSSNVVKVGGRFYRRNSPLLTTLSDGSLALRANLVITSSGKKLDKTNDNVVQVGNDYVERGYTVVINGNYYLKTDPNVIRLHGTNNYQLKSNCVLLSSKYYGQNAYVLERDTTEISNSELALTRDCIPVMGSLGVVTQEHVHVVQGGNFVTVFWDFTNVSDPRPNQIKNAYVNRSLITTQPSPFVQYTDDTYNVGVNGLWIHRSRVNYFDEKINQYIVTHVHPSCEKIRKMVNQNYSDLDDTENLAPKLTPDRRRYGGGTIITKSNKKKIISENKDLTGNVGYTFGVEIETAAGLVPSKIVNQIDVDQVGDRSIGSAEYVTGILHGSDGIKQLKVIADAIAEYTIVDDECSIHVHVGTLKDENVDQLTLDKNIAIKMIKLGAAVEESLFATLPPSRHVNMKHCHGISAYAGINKTNWQDFLGCFIFGNTEDSTKGLNMQNYTFGTGGRSESTTLSKYHTGGRYKWLNLVHCVTNSYVKTIEFRAFAGSTNFDKIYNYVLISLAMVKYADSRKLSEIKKSTSLSDVINDVYKDTQVHEDLSKFIELRTKRFNRIKPL